MPIPGVLGLLGGSEMGSPCEAFDRALLKAAGDPAEVNVLATAVVRNGSVTAAMANARDYFGGRFGLEVREVPLHRRADASRPEIVDALRASPLTYLLGGDPGYLLDTLLESPAWDAIREALGAGAALAGSSAGAMVTCETLLLRSRNPTPAARHARPGLHLMPAVLIPHLNTFGEGWLAAARREARGRDIMGLDESTGMVFAGSWSVHGPGQAKLWRRGAEPPRVFHDGDRPRWRVPRL